MTDPEHLLAWFGKVGVILHCFANGLDNTPVMAVGDETIIKSIGNSTTTPRDLTNELEAKIVFYMLAESVAERMRDHGFLAKTVQISVRDNGLFWFQKQMKLKEPTCLASELCETDLAPRNRASYNVRKKRKKTNKGAERRWQGRTTQSNRSSSSCGR